MSELETPQADDDQALDMDVVALLMRQHGDIRRGRAEPRRLVWLLAVHETAEAIAPTRPHPGVESAAADVALGPVAALGPHQGRHPQGPGEG